MLQVPVDVPGEWLVYEAWGLLACGYCRGVGVAGAWVLQAHIADAGKWLRRCVGVACRLRQIKSPTTREGRSMVPVPKA